MSLPATLRAMPIAPLAATLAVQTLATVALFSLPAIAPAVAASLHVNGALVGGFVATAYGTGIVSALLSPGLIRRYGGVRATQAVLLAAAGMVLIAATGHLVSLALAAVVLGLGYGAAAPASTHLLVPQTPRSVFNMVMSLRQIGVPLGGVLGALILPPLALAVGWRLALLAELGPLLLLLGLMELPRRRWDADRDPHARAFGRTLMAPFALLRNARIRRLSVASCGIERHCALGPAPSSGFSPATGRSQMFHDGLQCCSIPSRGEDHGSRHPRASRESRASPRRSGETSPRGGKASQVRASRKGRASLESRTWPFVCTPPIISISLRKNTRNITADPRKDPMPQSGRLLERTPRGARAGGVLFERDRRFAENRAAPLEALGRPKLARSHSKT